MVLGSVELVLVWIINKKIPLLKLYSFSYSYQSLRRTPFAPH